MGGNAQVEAMNIAFYGPMKSPDHPVPSGDRLMARLLIKAMRVAGHGVEVASHLRAYLRSPDHEDASAIQAEAKREIERISALWRAGAKPDIWFCYHPYYKALDLLGPTLCRTFGVAYVTAEASYAPKRNASGWADIQAALLDDLRLAASNICFTERDRTGLIKADPAIRSATLPPFIDTALFERQRPAPQPARLATVAMMRSGDKFASYEALAAALKLLPVDLPWTLDIIGDGPARERVQQLFTGLDSSRLSWHGEKNAEDIAGILSRASIYLWPGHGEAYGLAYLEAQATGLPVVAEHVAGVPEVVRDTQTGILTEPGDALAYAQAITQLLTNDAERQRLADNARRFATKERSLPYAAQSLDRILKTALEPAP